MAAQPQGVYSGSHRPFDHTSIADRITPARKERFEVFRVEKAQNTGLTTKRVAPTLCALGTKGVRFLSLLPLWVALADDLQTDV